MHICASCNACNAYYTVPFYINPEGLKCPLITITLWISPLDVTCGDWNLAWVCQIWRWGVDNGWSKGQGGGSTNVGSPEAGPNYMYHPWEMHLVSIQAALRSESPIPHSFDMNHHHHYVPFHVINKVYCYHCLKSSSSSIHKEMHFLISIADRQEQATLCWWIDPHQLKNIEWLWMKNGRYVITGEQEEKHIIGNLHNPPVNDHLGISCTINLVDDEQHGTHIRER